MSNESFHIVAPLDQIAICVIDRLFARSGARLTQGRF